MTVRPELGDGEEPARLVEQAPDAPGARPALVDELLDAAAPDRDERDLGGDEEPFEQRQEDDDDELNQCGVMPAPSSGGGFGRGSRIRARDADRELAGRHVLRDDRAGAGPGVVAERDRRAEHRVDAEEDAARRSSSGACAVPS